MTKREGAILSAYTGVMLCDFSEMHKYAEELFGHPIFTSQFAFESVAEKLKALAEKDFQTVIAGQI